jgi:hypothetical protein
LQATCKIGLKPAKSARIQATGKICRNQQKYFVMMTQEPLSNPIQVRLPVAVEMP